MSPASTVAGQSGDNAAPLVSVETPAPDELYAIAIYAVILVVVPFSVYSPAAFAA